jgi:type VI secretion system protein ImpH
MATPGGTEDSDVKQPAVWALLKNVPYEFNFYQAVRLLEQVLPDRMPVGRFTKPEGEIARFGANPNTSFPASHIQELEYHAGQPVELTVNFMGLFGPMGVLPLYYSHLVRDRMRNKDHAMRAFFDLFNHRMISLLYQAWEKYRFPVAYERAARVEGTAAAGSDDDRDRMSQYLLDLIGLGTKGLKKRQAVPDDSLLFYSGLLSLHTRSALALELILSDYFNVPVAVEQYVGKWYALERNAQCEFSVGNSHSEQLGIGAVVGDEVWDPQSGARVRIGPLPLVQYLDFLPNGSAYEPLRALTKFYSGGEIEYEVQLILLREEVPVCELGAAGEAGPQLGWITWMKNLPMDRDPEDTILRI